MKAWSDRVLQDPILARVGIREITDIAQESHICKPCFHSSYLIGIVNRRVPPNRWVEGFGDINHTAGDREDGKQRVYR